MRYVSSLKGKGERVMNFKKMHGLGNDFVILDGRAESVMLSQARIVRICDRHFGVGCDQLVVLRPSERADIGAVFYNADGSESGACGNATRCVADLLIDKGSAAEVLIETAGGLLKAWRSGDLISVDMGEPSLPWQQIPLAQPCDTQHLPIDGDPVAVNMGNPHCVFFSSEEAIDDFVQKRGSLIENNPLFPERTNVEFVQVLGDNRLRQRTWERGAGITLACGSGACAVAVAAGQRGLVDTARPVEVVLDGGVLYIEWCREKDGHVIMTGATRLVFEGALLDV